MSDRDYKNFDATRALQASLAVRRDNLASMTQWGAYSLLKVTAPGEAKTSVMNYVTLLQALSGKTPREMEDLLGLKVGQLAQGADLYRLNRLPQLDEFLPRGYTTLVNGLELRDGLKQDTDGYRPGQGAFQVTLIKPIEAIRIKTLAPGERFEPGIHPSLQHLYPKR